MTNALLAKEKGRSRLFRRGGTHNEICVTESHKCRTYTYSRTCIRIHKLTRARSSGILYTRVRIESVSVCVTPGASSGGPISVDHKGPQPSESLRVNNYYRAPCKPATLFLSVFSSPSRFAPSCATLVHSRRSQ